MYKMSFFSPECSSNLCTPAAGGVDPDLFKDFKRSLTWDISVPERTVLTLGFPSGLKELSGAEQCPDEQQYSVSTTRSEGKIKTSSYCKGGKVSHLDLLGATTVSVEVPKGEEGDSTVFTVKTAPRGKFFHGRRTCRLQFSQEKQFLLNLLLTNSYVKSFSLS